MKLWVFMTPLLIQTPTKFTQHFLDQLPCSISWDILAKFGMITTVERPSPQLNGHHHRAAMSDSRTNRVAIFLEIGANAGDWCKCRCLRNLQQAAELFHTPSLPQIWVRRFSCGRLRATCTLLVKLSKSHEFSKKLIPSLALISCSLNHEASLGSVSIEYCFWCFY